MAYSFINLLLVEDDEADVLEFKRSMRRHEVTNPLAVAGNGLEALNLLRGSQSDGSPSLGYPRLILLDLNLPVMDGLTFMKELRADADLYTTPIIVITASRDERDRAAALDMNVAGFFVKPVDFELLAKTMMSLHRIWEDGVEASTEGQQPVESAN